MNHSDSANNDYSCCLIVGWSKTVGDLRVLLFIAMHALQLLPFLYFFIFMSTKAAIILSLLHELLAMATLL
jgi:hypothetical protein